MNALDFFLDEAAWTIIGVVFVVAGGLLLAAAGGIGAQLFLWGSLLSCGLTILSTFDAGLTNIGGEGVLPGEGPFRRVISLFWILGAATQGFGLLLLARRVRAVRGFEEAGGRPARSEG